MLTLVRQKALQSRVHFQNYSSFANYVLLISFLPYNNRNLWYQKFVWFCYLVAFVSTLLFLIFFGNGYLFYLCFFVRNTAVQYLWNVKWRRVIRATLSLFRGIFIEQSTVTRPGIPWRSLVFCWSLCPPQATWTQRSSRSLIRWRRWSSARLPAALHVQRQHLANNDRQTDYMTFWFLANRT